jgi:translation initiation factor 2D
LAGVFEAVQAAADGLYTANEAYEVVSAYAKQADLEAGAPDNKTLVLDPLLCDALYKGTIKKGEFYPTHIAKV